MMQAWSWVVSEHIWRHVVGKIAGWGNSVSSWLVPRRTLGRIVLEDGCMYWLNVGANNGWNTVQGNDSI